MAEQSEPYDTPPVVPSIHSGQLAIERTDYLSRQNVKLRRIVGALMRKPPKKPINVATYSTEDLHLATPVLVDYDALGNTRVTLES